LVIIPITLPFWDTSTAFQSPISAVSVGMVVVSDTTGYDSPITFDTGVCDSSSMVTPERSFSRMILSDMLPTDTSPDITGSWEYPAVLMSSEAWWTRESLWIATTPFEQTSAAVRLLLSLCFMSSSVSNSLTTVS